jgi:hypothetical protein
MTRRNDEERRLWVLNDEGLYQWFIRSRPRLGIRAFIQANRAEIDECIDRVLNPRRGTAPTFEPHGRLP